MNIISIDHQGFGRNIPPCQGTGKGYHSPWAPRMPLGGLMELFILACAGAKNEAGMVGMPPH
jgi:hypothetical protein